MRRTSFIGHQFSASEERLGYDENGNNITNPNDPDQHSNTTSLETGCVGQGLCLSKSFSSFLAPKPTIGMTSRPSFISLMLIASDDELSRLPRLPAPLQVETETYQRCGWDDLPRVCSHLPILNPPSDSDEETEKGILSNVMHLPDRIRKISADKRRFNVYALPERDREQLKNLYVF